MDATDSVLEHLVSRARNGDADALGELLERHRPYLRVLALRQLDARLAARVDASDVVQQTCMSVFKKFDEFTGDDIAEFVAWLRKLHECNVRDVIRDNFHTKKRSVSREHQPDGESEAGIEPVQTVTPSRRLIADENSLRLAQALAALPEAQREAVRLRHLEGCSLVEIARQLGRSEQAAAGLVKRGISALRKTLE